MLKQRALCALVVACAAWSVAGARPATNETTRGGAGGSAVLKCVGSVCVTAPSEEPVPLVNQSHPAAKQSLPPAFIVPAQPRQTDPPTRPPAPAPAPAKFSLAPAEPGIVVQSVVPYVVPAPPRQTSPPALFTPPADPRIPVYTTPGIPSSVAVSRTTTTTYTSASATSTSTLHVSPFLVPTSTSQLPWTRPSSTSTSSSTLSSTTSTSTLTSTSTTISSTISTATTRTTPTTPPTPTGTSIPPTHTAGTGLSKGQMIAIILSSAALLVILAAIIFAMRRYLGRRRSALIQRQHFTIIRPPQDSTMALVSPANRIVSSSSFGDGGQLSDLSTPNLKPAPLRITRQPGPRELASNDLDDDHVRTSTYPASSVYSSPPLRDKMPQPPMPGNMRQPPPYTSHSTFELEVDGLVNAMTAEDSGYGDDASEHSSVMVLKDDRYGPADQAGRATSGWTWSTRPRRQSSGVGWSTVYGSYLHSPEQTREAAALRRETAWSVSQYFTSPPSRPPAEPPPPPPPPPGRGLRGGGGTGPGVGFM